MRHGIEDRSGRDNLILIGMPGCGKSTAGVVLAKVLGYRFVDADLVIQEREGRVLSEILATEGQEGFRQVEEAALLSIRAARSVIATGGSAVYCPRGMEYLRSIGTLIYLYLPCDHIAARLGDLNDRGVSRAPGQTLEDLYRERTPLYERYADLTLDASDRDIPHLIRMLRSALSVYRSEEP